MSEPAVEGTSGDGEKKEKKNESSYEYGSCCPHVAQVSYVRGFVETMKLLIFIRVRFFGKIQIRILVSKNGFCVSLPKSENRLITG